MKLRSILCLLWGIAVSLGAQDSRSRSLDFIVLLDKSLSMVDKIEPVKDWFSRQILNSSLRPGDSLLLVAFYGKTELLADQVIKGAADIAVLTELIRPLTADGPYTDIGGALDEAARLVAERPRQGDRQHFLLLTDGIHEPPPGSRYPGPKGPITHSYLSSAKTLAQNQWKIQILGIGTDTAAEELAREFQSAFETLPEAQSLLFLDESRWAAGIDWALEPRLSEGTLGYGWYFTLEPYRIAKTQELNLNQARLRWPDGSVTDLLTAPLTWPVSPDDLWITGFLPLDLTVLPRISEQQPTLTLDFSGALRPLSAEWLTPPLTLVPGFVWALPFSLLALGLWILINRLKRLRRPLVELSHEVPSV